jgi:hypothetical protein
MPRCTHDLWSPRAWPAWRQVVNGGPPVDEAWRGLPEKHQRWTTLAPGKEGVAGAHLCGMLPMRWWSWRRAAADLQWAVTTSWWSYSGMDQRRLWEGDWIEENLVEKYTHQKGVAMAAILVREAVLRWPGWWVWQNHLGKGSIARINLSDSRWSKNTINTQVQYHILKFK